MKVTASRNNLKLPVDVFADISVQGDMGGFKIESYGRFLVVKQPFLNDLSQCKMIAQSIVNLPRLLLSMDRLLKCLDVNLCLRYKKLVIIGANANPLILAALNAITRFGVRFRPKSLPLR